MITSDEMIAWLKKDRFVRIIQTIFRYVFFLTIFALLLWLAYVIGLSDGRGQVVSVYEHLQPIRVTQRLLKQQGYYKGRVDGIVGLRPGGTLEAWKLWDKRNCGFIEEYVFAKEFDK